MKKINYKQFIKDNLISADISYRGGTLKVDVSSLFSEIEKDQAIMGAIQNYLGGGIAGAICGVAMFEPSELSKKNQKIFFELKEEIKQAFYNENNGGGDEYMQENVTGGGGKGYIKNQSLPASGY
jgi:hypothetical protein